VPKEFFSLNSIANKLTARARWSSASLTNKRVSKRVILALIAWGYNLRAKGAFSGPFAAATCAYVVRGLTIA
jgi:hypothetical protein